VQGFKVGFAGHNTVSLYAEMVLINGGSDLSIVDCLFSDVTDYESVTLVRAMNSVNLTIANCRIAHIERDQSATGVTDCRGIYAINCPGIAMRNNVVTDLSGMNDFVSKSTLVCQVSNTAGVTVSNNLVHHIEPRTQDTGINFIIGFLFDECSDILLANNTMDNLDTTNASPVQQIYGYYLDTCEDVSFTNNIMSEFLCGSGPGGLGRGVHAINCSVTCDYACVWNVTFPYSNGAGEGTGCILADPEYIDPDNGDYEISGSSQCQDGDPSILDWDDSGSGGSRMGCHGGPGGENVGLLTPE
jgi:hypothetical protein